MKELTKFKGIKKAAEYYAANYGTFLVEWEGDYYVSCGVSPLYDIGYPVYDDNGVCAFNDTDTMDKSASPELIRAAKSAINRYEVYGGDD